MKSNEAAAFRFRRLGNMNFGIAVETDRASPDASLALAGGYGVGGVATSLREAWDGICGRLAAVRSCALCERSCGWSTRCPAIAKMSYAEA